MIALKLGFRSLLLALVSVVFVNTVWAALTPEQVTTRIRTRMLKSWTCSNLRVQVTPCPNNANIERGAFKQIRVTADSVIIDGVKMTQVLMAAQDPVLDLGKLVQQNKVVLLRRSSDSVRARLSEKDLNIALARKKNTIENLRVKVGDSRVTFTGKYKFGLATSLMLQGRLEVPDGYKVNFIPTKASVGGLPLPTTPLRGVLNKMNPLIDFQKIMMAPRIDRLIVEPGYITMMG